MRVLIDIVHPAHVHFYRHMVSEMIRSGHEVAVAARDKDVTLDLLEAFAIPHTSIGRARGNSFVRLGAELVSRVTALRRLGREFGAEVVLTRNPAGVQAARLLGVPGIFDTDDGAAAGIHWKAAVPFATYITMPDVVTDDHRGRRVAYPSYKVLAYLHPDRFAPDPTVLDELGVAPDERFFIVRFVAMAASHDRSELGMADSVKQEVIARLRPHGTVFTSTETAEAGLSGARPLRLAPHRMHDALAHAALLVGDSQTMAAEAAVLGVPNVRLSSWVGRLAYLTDIEERYGLTEGFAPTDVPAFLARVDELAGSGSTIDTGAARRQLLRDKVDLVTWYCEFVERVVGPSAGSAEDQ